MSHDIFKPSNLIGCLENKTADWAQTRKRAIVTRPFPSPGGRGLGTRLSLLEDGVYIKACLGEYFVCSTFELRGSIYFATASSVPRICIYLSCVYHKYRMIKSTTRSIWTGSEQDNDANVFSFPHGGSPYYDSDLESQQILQLRLLFFICSSLSCRSCFVD